jgi:transcriptional regulator with XRE-family HTH domain
MRARSQATAPEPSAVLTKAALHAAELLGMSAAHLAAVIGVSPASLSRLRSSERAIDPHQKEGELALLFVRMYRSLAALLGDTASCRSWFHSENVHLGGVPAGLVRRIEGLVHVNEYLDAMRGKV